MGRAESVMCMMVVCDSALFAVFLPLASRNRMVPLELAPSVRKLVAPTGRECGGAVFSKKCGFLVALQTYPTLPG